MTEAQILKTSSQLREWRFLLENDAWKEFFALLKEKEATHHDGLRARNKTAEQRAEHLEASFTVEELIAYAAGRVGELEGELRAWRDQQPMIE